MFIKSKVMSKYNSFFKDDYPMEEKKVENVDKEETKKFNNISGISETEVTTIKPYYI